MKKIAIAMAVLMVALIAAPNLLAQAQSASTIISVDQVSANPGDHVAIPVRMSDNSLELGGLSVPLQFAPGSFTVDSISNVGALDANNINAGHSFDNTAGTIRINYLPGFPANGEPVPSFFLTKALLATVYVTIDESAAPSFQAIDSVNSLTIYIDSITTPGVYIDFPVRERIHMSDPLGFITYLPQFEYGGVEVTVSTGIEDGNGSGNLPTAFALAQNYPNPFNPSTTIEYALPTASRVQIEVFNVLGQSVAMLVDENKPAGTHQVEFDASSQPSGMFFYRITHAQGSLTKKMILVK